MGWNPNKDPQRRGQNDPERKPEFPPKGKQPSDEALRKLGRSAIKGSQKK